MVEISSRFCGQVCWHCSEEIHGDGIIASVSSGTASFHPQCFEDHWKARAIRAVVSAVTNAGDLEARWGKLREYVNDRLACSEESDRRKVVLMEILNEMIVLERDK
jgi:hypothetical protein